MSHTKLSDGTTRTHRALMLALSGEVTVRDAATRFGVSKSQLYKLMMDYRRRQRAGQSEGAP